MKIHSLRGAQEILRQVPGMVVGAGVTAWARSGVADLLPKYEVVAFKDSSELGQLRNSFPVKVAHKRLGKQNTGSILADEGIQAYLKGLPEPRWLFVYKSSKKVEELVDRLGLKLVGNRSEVRDAYEDKRQFRVIGEQVGLPLVDGETLKIEELTEEKAQEYVNQWGKIVLQLTDYSRGGGVGTFFIHKQDEFADFKNFVRRRSKGRTLEWVNATRFIEGTQASIAGCVTRHGVLTGVVQGQIMDQPELTATHGA